MPLAKEAVASGAQLLFLPEYCGGLVTEGAAVVPPSAPEGTHPFLSNIQHFARDARVWVNVGSVAVDGADGRIINRGFMIDPLGDIQGHYDKIHMFDIQLSDTEIYRESDRVSPGSHAIIHDTEFCRIGHTICYDLRFPELFRTLAKAGADVLICPAAFTKKTGEAHWHVLNRARAIENTRFVVSCCAVGDVPGGGACYGHSLVVTPWGDIIADGGSTPGVVRARLDLEQVTQTASRIPSLQADRSYRIAEVSDKSVA
ncbi:MAG: carbon-nitrogen hydrolase family protein [Pseudomonadota bacterium]